MALPQDKDLLASKACYRIVISNMRPEIDIITLHSMVYYSYADKDSNYL